MARGTAVRGREGGGTRRERALKVVLVLVGLLSAALVYPLVLFVKQEPALAMMLSVYATLGIFLLLASRNPSGNRSPDRLRCLVELRARCSHGGASFR